MNIYISMRDISKPASTIFTFFPIHR